MIASKRLLLPRALISAPAAVRPTAALTRQCSTLRSTTFTPARRPRLAIPRSPAPFASLGSLRFNSTVPSSSSSSSATTPDAIVSPPAADTFTGHDVISDALTSVPAKAADQLGYLQSLGIDFGWGTSTLIQSLIESIHVFSGTPWWASIALTVLVVRGVQFPFYCRMSDNTARMKEVNPILVPLTKKMQSMQAAGDQIGMAEANQERKRVLRTAGVNNWWLAFPITQIPIFYGAYKTLEKMAHLPVPELLHEGTAWFTDLSTADPFMAIPMATAAMMGAQIAMGGEAGANNMAESTKRILSVALPAFTLWFTYSWPAAVVWYFFCNAAWGFAQTLVLKSAWVRQRLGLYPLHPAQSINPLGPNRLDALNIASQALPSKTIDVKPAAKQIGGKGSLLDRFTGGGKDEKGSRWSIQNLRTDSEEKARASKHKHYEQKRQRRLEEEKKAAQLEAERKRRMKRAA